MDQIRAKASTCAWTSKAVISVIWPGIHITSVLYIHTVFIRLLCQSLNYPGLSLTIATVKTFEAITVYYLMA